MKTLLLLAAASLAVTASASELGIMKKQRGAVRRGGVSAHTAPRAAAASAPSSGAASSFSGSGSVVVSGGGSSGPSAASGATRFVNGRPLGAPRTQGVSGSPKLLRSSSGPSSAASAAAAPASAPKGYSATAAGPSSTTGGGTGRIAADPKAAHSTAGPGVTQQAAPDTAPGGASGASGKNPMDAIMDGLANMFKDMANMLGGGSKNGG